MARWNPMGEGKEIWDQLLTEGQLDDKENPTPSEKGKAIAAAVRVAEIGRGQLYTLN